jgi:peptide/nickel transport system ATP-binding protein
MREVIRRHTGLGRSAAKELAIETLASVGIPDPARRYDEYTFQLSGGMRQRAMIAIAISCHPKLLVADEPTTALDVTTQAQILDLLRRISVENGMSVLLISHDLGVVAELCERLICVYAGQVVEEAGIDTALLQPRHPYLSGLLRSMPRNEARGTRLASIPGVVPSPGAMPEGCRFGPRCAHHTAVCDEPQILRSAAAGVSVRCGRSAELELTGVIHEEGSR